MSAFSTDLLYKLATASERFNVLDFQNLLKRRREDGMKCYIHDLRTVNHKGSGWDLTKGVLTIQENCISQEIEEFLESRLSSFGWFQTRAKKIQLELSGTVFEKPDLPLGYSMYPQSGYKVLGQWGSNPAMDLVILIILPDGSMSVRVGKKPTGEFCFTGGMINKTDTTINAALRQLVNECFEENYSLRFLEPGSLSLVAVEKMNLSAAQKEDIIDMVLSNEEFKNPEFQKYKQVFKIGSTFSSSYNSFIAGIRKIKEISKENAETQVIAFKKLLFEYLFPDNYRSFINFLYKTIQNLEWVFCSSDPRNTQEAFMITQPFYIYTDLSEISQHEREWNLEPKGGDDVKSSHTELIQDLVKKPMFASHRSILIKVLRDFVEKNPQKVTSIMTHQFDEIMTILTDLEIKELGIVGNHANICSESQLQQLEILRAQDDNIRIEVDKMNSVEMATEFLENKLSELRMARLRNKQEDLGLSLSFRISLALLAEKDTIYIVIDNSGSMNGKHSSGLTLWAKLLRDIKYLLPLLALVAVNVKVIFINEVGSAMKNDSFKEFDFSVGENDISNLESKLNCALLWFDELNFARPSGSTVVNGIFTRILSDSHNQNIGVIFLTDGEADDKTHLSKTIKNRNPPYKSPIIVIGCCKNSETISWVRDLQRETQNCITMLDDFETQEKRFKQWYGDISFSDSTYLGMFVTFPCYENNHFYGKGFHIYVKLDKIKAELSREDYYEILGYENSDAYDEYVASRI
uniref:VWFA domain-containing protein n=1 Tax=viral metagenome TaxID=1070528 RepID=A0A6C0BEL8_9ZZZZ